MSMPQQPSDDAANEAWRRAEGHRLLVRVRALLAMAESSEFAAEARAFSEKAGAMADEYGIEPALLLFPREPLRVAVIVAELQRLQQALEDYGADEGLWATKSAEWSTLLDEYDSVLEAAAEMVQLPVPRLPYGCRRHFRPEERSHIEQLVRQKVQRAVPPRVSQEMAGR
jgi:hypothetical protein